MAKKKPTIITDNASLAGQYEGLAAGDIVVGRVRMLASEESMLVDLLTRGVRLLPSALSQLASRSKTLQAKIFAPWMLPHTLAVHDSHQLLALLAAPPSSFEHGVITKLERKNAGMGIHLWPSLEDVYNQASLGALPYPFVLQPFVPGARDIRVIVIGDYCEAYWRDNPNSFRNNLHCGGESTPCTLDGQQRRICEQVMARGAFPYAHLDLLVTPQSETFLTEINLRGGIKGAMITAAAYRQRVAVVEKELLANALGEGATSESVQSVQHSQL